MLTPALARHARSAAAVASAGALALGFAACGSEDSDDAETASAVPASAPLYFEVAIRPEGDLKENTESAISKIGGIDDPAAEIQKWFAEQDTGDDITYEDDIAPWLGETASGFATGFTGTTPDGAIVIESTDDDKAQALVDQAEDTEEQTYEDVTYRYNGEMALGVTDGFVILGTERGFRTAVDTLKGDADTIEDSDQFEQAIDAVGGDDDALGLMYFETEAMIDAFARSGGVPQETLAQVREQLAKTGGDAGAVKLGVTEDAISVEAATIGAENADAGGDASAALEALPGDAWMAIGFGAIGERIELALDGASQAASTAGVDLETQLQQLEAQTGISVRQDLLSWMGDGALFVSGSGVADIGGALVVQTTDPKTTSGAIVKVAELLRRGQSGVELSEASIPGAETAVRLSMAGSPVPLILAVAGDKFVAGVGEASVTAAIDPQTTLADSDAYAAAKDALGGDMAPTFLFDTSATVQIIEALGDTNDPSVAQMRDALGRFGVIAAGSKVDGDVASAKLVATLK